MGVIGVEKGMVEVKGPCQRRSASATNWVDRRVASGPAIGETALAGTPA
jgi:hypothetical protein